jgi:hypothetical protein
MVLLYIDVYLDINNPQIEFAYCYFIAFHSMKHKNKNSLHMKMDNLLVTIFKVEANTRYPKTVT